MLPRNAHRLRDMTAGPWRAVSVLGVTQIIAWGTIFYSPVLTVPLIAAETRLVAVLHHGRLLARPAGRGPGRRRSSAASIDRHGGHVVMTAGSLISALGLLGLAYAARSASAISRSGWCSARGSAPRSTIRPSPRSGASSAPRARRPITVLTLAGGFASTVGWPATHLLIGAVGWRGTYLVYAALLAAVCAPLLCLRAAAQPRRRRRRRRADRPRGRPRCCRRTAWPSCW